MFGGGGRKHGANCLLFVVTPFWDEERRMEEWGGKGVGGRGFVACDICEF